MCLSGRNCFNAAMATTVRNLVTVVLLVGGLGLAGCGSDEKTISINGDKVSVDNDGGGVKIETDDGTATFGSGSLPEDFPEDDVPIIDGTIAGGGKNTADGETMWSLILQTDGEVGSVLADVTGKLEGAGYTSESSGNYGGNAAAQFTGKYAVGVSVTGADGQIAVTYVVSSATR